MKKRDRIAAALLIVALGWAPRAQAAGWGIIGEIIDRIQQHLELQGQHERQQPALKPSAAPTRPIGPPSPVSRGL